MNEREFHNHWLRIKADAERIPFKPYPFQKQMMEHMKSSSRKLRIILGYRGRYGHQILHKSKEEVT